MKATDLMERLAVMWPGAYAVEGIPHWTEVAVKLFGGYEGAPLKAAWDEVIGSWSHGWAPKPNDFVKAAEAWIRDNRSEQKARFGRGPDRLRNWATFILEETAKGRKFEPDAVRVAHDMLASSRGIA